MALPFVRHGAAHDERRSELALPGKITPHRLASQGRAPGVVRTFDLPRLPLSRSVRSVPALLKTP